LAGRNDGDNSVGRHEAKGAVPGMPQHRVVADDLAELLRPVFLQDVANKALEATAVTTRQNHDPERVGRRSPLLW
jgi:hypothetical protein